MVSSQFVDSIRKLLRFKTIIFTQSDSETREINEKDLEKLVEQRVVEIKELDSQVRGCQQTITDMYVSKLSNVDVSQCQIQ